MKIVLATENLGKLKEIQAFLKDLPITLIPQSSFHVPTIAETGLSFVENALLKARHAAKYSDLGALADDSGLSVDVLGGAPGIYSARYAGIDANEQENISKLLNAMASYPDEARRAYFHCAIVFVKHYADPTPIICQAQWEGRILSKAVGTGGFGYDPVFYLPSLHCTVAELTSEQKNMLSHRAQALTEFVKQFRLYYSVHDS